MTRFKTTPAAYKLLHMGTQALAECEHNGVRVDKGRLDATIIEQEKRVGEMARELMADPVYGVWKKAYGDRANFGSRDQLADVVFDKLGYEAKEYTTGGKTGRGRAKANKPNLELIDLPFVNAYMRMESLKKAISTNLIGIRREMVEESKGMWFVHPFFSLNTTNTLRSSSNMPNWQNYPKRNPEIAGMVRPVFIPRPGRSFWTADLGQIEVRVPAAITGDRELMRYVTDPNSDMHRDQAANVYMLPPGEVPKNVRQSVKGIFVFAMTYGAGVVKCAKGLWDDIDRYGLKTKAGVPLKEHLRKKGIIALGDCTGAMEPVSGTFVHHIKQMQAKFWQQFAGYAAWRRTVIDKYRREGGQIMVTGFAVNGQRSATEIPNYLIQGPAFHINLQALIWIVGWVRKYRLSTCLIGEIHDEIEGDSPPNELNDVLGVVREYMTERIRREWKWITVPLTSDIGVAPVDKSWYDCRQWTETDGRWALKG